MKYDGYIRKGRKHLHNSRNVLLGNYIIVTDTKKTEELYFKGLKESLPFSIGSKIRIKVVGDVETKKIVDTAIEYREKNPNYSSVSIVLDKDKNVDFDEIIDNAIENFIIPLWANPCFEMWLMRYFNNSSYSDSKICCKKFSEIYLRNTGKEYNKINSDLYKQLIKYGNEKSAVKISDNQYNTKRNAGIKLPSKMDGVNTIYKFIEKIIELNTINCKS